MTPLHPTGRALNAYWSVNSIIMVNYEKKFKFLTVLWTESFD